MASDDREDRDEGRFGREGEYGGGYGRQERQGFDRGGFVGGSSGGYGRGGMSDYGAGRGGIEGADYGGYGAADFGTGRGGYGGAGGMAPNRARGDFSERAGRSFDDQPERIRSGGNYGAGGGLSGGVANGYGGFGAERERGRFAGRGPKGYRRSDERIHEDVCEALTRHPDVDASDLEVHVEGGEVTLTGTVDGRAAKRLAEDVVEQISGVTDIHNQIRVARGASGEREIARGAMRDESARDAGGSTGTSTSSG